MRKIVRVATCLHCWAQKPSYQTYANILAFCLMVTMAFVWIEHKEVRALQERVAMFDQSNQGLMLAYAAEKARKPKFLLVKPTDPVVMNLDPVHMEYTGPRDIPPLAFTNKNPLNVKPPARSTWKGQIGVDHIGHAKFQEWEDGIRASAIVLKNYVTRHQIDTIRGIVTRFAEGNQEPYMAFLEKRLKVHRDEPFNILRRLPEILKAMARFESGQEFPDRYFAPYDVVKYLVMAQQEEKS